MHAVDLASRRARALAFGVVFVLTLACFLPALRNTIGVWDDHGYILENERIRTLSLETVRWAFGEYCCNFWAPLTFLSLAVDHAIWGLNPIGYHLTNAVMHAANAGLFFLLAWELLRASSAGARAAGGTAPAGERTWFWTAMLAALLFAVHPLRVESVAWATERKDVLSLLFGLPALIAWVRHAAWSEAAADDERVGAFAGSRAYWVAFGGFCLSLLAKPMLVTLPIVLLLLDAFPLRRFRRGRVPELLAEKAPFVAAAALVAAISAAAQSPQTMSLAEAGVAARILNAVRSIASYLRLTAWPVDVSAFYLHPKNAPLAPVHVVSAALLVAITAAAALQARRRPALLVAWAAYLAALLPVLGFVQVGPQAMAARFTYFPSLGPSLLVAAGVVLAAERARSGAARAAIVAATALALAGLAAVTVRDIGFWKDDIALWTRVIELDPGATGRAYFQRGVAYGQAGDAPRALADLDAALAIAVRKGYRQLHEIHSARARIHAGAGRPWDAVAEYGRALETAEGRERAELLMERGAMLRAVGEEDLATDDFARAARGE